MGEPLPTMRRLASIVAVFMVVGSAVGVDSKIDEAIPLTGESFHPVFVRMEDQLFRKAGDHEAFCKKHSDRPRSQNRKEVTAVLQKKADDSWQKIEELMTKLEKERFGVFGTAIGVPDLHLIIKTKPRQARHCEYMVSASFFIGRYLDKQAVTMFSLTKVLIV